MNDVNLLYLEKSINENKLSHAFLIETNNFDECVNDIFSLFLRLNLIYSNNDILNNISVRIIRPVNNSIDKDEILSLQSFLTTTSFDGKYKIYFIVGADMLNLSSANKLLKTLEEPVTKSVGFLITDNVNLILPTLYSRCQIISNSCKLHEFKLDSKLFDILKDFRNIDFESYVSFKQELLKLDKLDIINMFDAYSSYLISCNSTFLISVTDFLSRIKSNANIELQLDRFYIERNKIK